MNVTELLDQIESRHIAWVRWLLDELSAAVADNEKKDAALRAVHTIAFDPDVISALEHGVVSDGLGGGFGISAPEAMGYAVEALRDIRAAIEEALS